MAATMTIEIPSDVLESARMSVQDAMLELAITLYSHERLSLGKAAELAGVPVGRFQLHLGAREIGPHYDVSDALDDRLSFATARGR
jgi:predicted HTH domain antitoxin